MSHIAVERNRRKQMNEHLQVLRTLTPCFYIKRGMESNIDSVERGAGKNKRKWTEVEDEMLIEALLELVNNRKFEAEKGFKSGYLGYLESALETKLPNSGIKGKPHIESRIKTLKTSDSF